MYKSQVIIVSTKKPTGQNEIRKPCNLDDPMHRLEEGKLRIKGK